MLKILWKMGEIAPEEHMLNFYVKNRDQIFSSR